MNLQIPFPRATLGSLCGLCGLLVLGLVVARRPAIAFEPTLANLPLSINLTIEIYELPREKFHELTQQQPGLRNDDVLLKKIRGLVADKEAKLTEHHSLNTRSGQRASMASGSEIIFGTEFNEETAMPTAFEMRKAGFSAKVDPVIGPDSFTVDLNLAVEICEFLGMEKTRYTNPKTKKSCIVEQPRFYSRKLTTAITSYDGMPRLMGNFGAKGDPTGKTGIIGVVFVTPTLVN